MLKLLSRVARETVRERVGIRTACVVLGIGIRGLDHVCERGCRSSTERVSSVVSC